MLATNLLPIAYCRAGNYHVQVGSVTGAVLSAEDLTGTGHQWHMVGDDPWQRARVIFPPGADTQFVPAVT